MVYHFAEVTLTGLPALVAIYALVSIPVVAISIIIASTVRRLHIIRQVRSHVIVAEYEPPLNLSPAEIGYLYDTKVQRREMLATIIDLEQRGFLALHKNNQQASVRPHPKGDGKLKDYEQLLISALQQRSHIDTTLFASHSLQFGYLVRQHLIRKGYLRGNVLGHYIRLMIRTNLMAALLCPGLFMFVGLLNADTPSATNVLSTLFGIPVFAIFLSPFYSPISILFVAIYARIVGQSWLKTSKLKKSWREIEGYRLYVRMVELDNLRFESKNKRAAIKNKVLPYAIALGFKLDI